LIKELEKLGFKVILEPIDATLEVFIFKGVAPREAHRDE
jgi:hypothetical protein